MNKFLKFTGLLFWLAALLYGAYMLYHNFPTVAANSLMVLGALFLIFILIRLYYGKDWIAKSGKEFFIGSDLIKATENFLETLPNPNKAVTANFVGHLVYRFTRLGLIGLGLALIPVWLLYNQNRLITKQNEFIETQTKRLDQQTYLHEAERRKPSQAKINSILEKMERELRLSDSLSNHFISSLGATLMSLQPYKYLDGDSLTYKPFSPEKSTIFLHLIVNNIGYNEWCLIKDNISFTNLDLKNIGFPDNLDISNITMHGTTFQGSTIRYVKLNGGRLNNCSFSDTDLWYGNLRSAFMPNCDFSKARLHKNNFSKSTLQNSNFQFTQVSSVIMDSTDLARCDFRNASIFESSFKGANFKDAKAFESQRHAFIHSELNEMQLNQIHWLKNPKAFNLFKPSTWY